VSSAIIITTKIADRPNLGSPEATERVTGGLTQMYSAEENGFLSIRFLGDAPQGSVYWVTGDQARIDEIQGAGIVVTRPQQSFGQPIIGVLRAAGVKGIYRVSNNQRVGVQPPVVIAGQSPFAEGTNGLVTDGDSSDVGDTYEVRDL